VTKAELIRFLEPFADDIRILVYGLYEPDPISIEKAEHATVDGEGTALLKLSSARVRWEEPEDRYATGLRRAQELAKELSFEAYGEALHILAPELYEAIDAEVAKEGT
jgi:hypothetical protein